MDKKELIRQHAEKLISKKGYHNTKIQEITKEANISVGTVYNYFSSKEEIIEYIFYTQCKKISNYIDEINMTAIDTTTKIRYFIEFCITDLEDAPDTLKIIVQEGSLLMNLNSKINKIINELIAKVASLIEEGKKKEEIKDVDTCFFTTIILYVIHGAMNGCLFSEKEYDCKKNNEQLISFIMDGLKK